MQQTILYIGGFELPDKNAAAHRVIGIAKGLRELGHDVIFLNSLKIYDKTGVFETEYFGFSCFEYKREYQVDYLFWGRTALSMIRKTKPTAVIAYNYPAFALNRIRKYCLRNNIKCFADTTEWYEAVGENPIYRFIKNLDTMYRMKYVQKKLDGVIAISRYLYDYYRDSIKTILIPPTVDIKDKKWKDVVEKTADVTSFVYAGVPSLQKEKLDEIVSNFCKIEKTNNVRLNIVGITRDKFVQLYQWQDQIPDTIVFFGRLDHQRVLHIVKQSNWAIILRDNNRIVKAGFPTKLVESISCGTPVIVNQFSNICEYLNNKNSIIYSGDEPLFKVLQQACSIKITAPNDTFDYHYYLCECRELLL